MPWNMAQPMMSMTLSGEDEEELRSYFDKLSAGGMVVMPMEKGPWGDTFGMLKDKFGVDWMVDVTIPRP
jgi:PhnB protein